MNTSDVLLLLNGELGSLATVRAVARRGAVVLCADGGARHAARLGLSPMAVIGDMDSLPPKLPRWKSTLFICDFDPDVSDFEKALRFIGRRRFTRAAKRLMGPPSQKAPIVHVAGLAGGRLDHQLFNWALFERYAEDLKLRAIDGDGGVAFVAGKGRHLIPCRKGATVSLLPLVGGATMTTRGLQYPLRRQRLGRDSLGLSNRALCANPSVEVHSGRVWIALP